MPMATSHSLPSALAVLVTAVTAGAATPESVVSPAPETFFDLDVHGYLRFRADLFGKGDLDARVGGLVTPIDELGANAALDDGNGLQASSNLRLRLEPTFRVGQLMRIRGTLDILDNLVLGSTPDFHSERADVTLAALAEGQAPADAAISAKRLWLEWEFFHGIVLSAGRMADHFGLGIVKNGGDGLDSDYGSSTDRVALLLQAFGVHSEWFFDSPYEGATTRDELGGYGQASDFGSVDDAIHWGFTVGMRPIGALAEEARQKELAEGKPAVDFVIRNAFTTHDFESAGVTDATLCSAAALHPYDCLRLQTRSVSLWLPDVWVRVLWSPSKELDVRVELELAGVVGSASQTQNLTDPASDKDFLALGGALEVDVRHQDFRYQLNFGAASGDDVAMGPYGESWRASDDAAYAQSDRLRDNTEITQFLFHRDYHVDLLLYREVLGGVSNSFYLRPSVTWTPIDVDGLRIGGSLAALYAHAILAESTPGKDNPLGLEFDLNVFYEQMSLGGTRAGLRFDVDAGVLIPFGGLDHAAAGLSAGPAFTFQARIGLLY